MGSALEATFHGFIHSTRDALLIFEAVRRGILPKITRRLRDDERKTIRSGTVFVFDESEANIKRWTDGMIWSPSRILNNFLVYREVEKKDPKPPADQPAFANSQPGFPLPGPPLDEHGGHQYSHSRPVPLTLSSSTMDGDSHMSLYHPQSGFGHLEMAPSSSNSMYGDHERFYGSSSHPQTQATGMVVMASGPASPTQARRDAEMDRNIVGSLTNSYPFIKDGLCKKTISINVEGSTQHLISYYTINDVQNQRLTVPSNLPEIASLSISPIFLNKINFRYPPVVDFGPDGIPRYVGESTESARTPGHISSGNESYVSGNESRHSASLRESPRGMVLYSPTNASDPSMSDPHYRFPHQIGGSGMLNSPTSFASTTSNPSRSRRPSEVNRKRSNSRYEPYGHATVPSASPWTSHGYTSGLDVNGSSLNRRSFPPPQRGWTDLSGSSAVQHDPSVFSVGQMMHSDSQPSGMASGNFGAALPSIGHLSQASGLPQQSFSLTSPASPSSFPTVPSQPSRNAIGFTDALQIKPEFDTKSESADMFHFNSSRFARGSWDSNQPGQTAARLHQLQQPPATSQGLTAMSLYSQSTFGPSMYDRAAQSPPPTSSSHDSRQSMASGTPSSSARIEELIDGLHPPTSNQLDVTEASRDDRFGGKSGSAGTVNDPRAQSGPSSPFSRPSHPSFGQSMISPGLHSRSVNDSRTHQHQPPFLANPYSQQPHQQGYHSQGQQNSSHSEYTSDLDGQPHASGIPVAKPESQWHSDSVKEGGSYHPESQTQFSPRPEATVVQSQIAEKSLEVHDAKSCRSGFETVMLTRPAL